MGFSESLYRGGWESSGLCPKNASLCKSSVVVAITNNDSSRTNYTKEQFSYKNQLFPRTLLCDNSITGWILFDQRENFLYLLYGEFIIRNQL